MAKYKSEFLELWIDCMNPLARKFFIGLAFLFTLLTIGSLLGRFYWILDVFSHYHLQYTVALTLLLLLLVLSRVARPLLVVPTVALLVNLYLVVPFFLPPAPSIALADVDTPTLRVIAMNISTSNAGYDKVVAHIREHQPDLVFMAEVREDLLALLEAELHDDYPYLHAEPSRMTLGVAFLSRIPFRSVETVMPGERGRRYLHATLDWAGETVTIVGIHPLPPMAARWAESRNSEIALMGQIATETADPFILLGDLNASPWSAPMRALMASTDLHYALQGYGVWPTWLLGGALLGAPLDYVLISPEWHVVDYTEHGDIGSDHLPVQADLMLHPAQMGE